MQKEIDNHNRDLLKLVNKHGYLFQWRVKTEVEERGALPWEVASWEHHWVNSKEGTDGYIDLILEHCRHTAFVLIVECKRVDQGQWVFLVQTSDSQRQQTMLASCFYVKGHVPTATPDKQRLMLIGYSDFSLTPSSPESDMCIIRGEGDRDKPMLERISARLLDSTYAVAVEELCLRERPQNRIYVPMIITSAQIRVCRFATDNISLLDGNLSEANFETVPFIRFRKSITTSTISMADRRNIKKSSLRGLAQAKERTILVVNSASLFEILKSIEPIGAFPGMSS
ncbi:MAG: hypothetical protein CVU57_16300 [Deltaproteobacteria bacterium HGW-Deltaproteobacteria-15]|jgi:hypothetical protein|nr:MAG: hypothetical protein CVU57_16300 [Deltaproteobacteria bacterium HGW-Deltaproteobacteria-15]